MRKLLLASLAILGFATRGQTAADVHGARSKGQRLDTVLGPQLSVAQFGASADDATDDTAAFQAAINAAAARKRTLIIPATGTGAYRLGNLLNWGTVNLQIEEGAVLMNLDGTPYTGFYSGFVPLAQTMNPGMLAVGKRVTSPGVDTVALDSLTSNAGYARQFITLYQGQSTGGANPFTTNGAIRAVGLLGQNGPSSGSFGALIGQLNNYSNTNGPGITTTGTLTNGSAVITNISTAGMFDPAQVTSNVSGFPVNAFVVDGGLQPNSITLNAPYTGPTITSAFVTVVSGFSELTPIAVGSFDVDGPVNRKTEARYFDYDISTNVSSDPNDQERYLSGGTHFVVKYVPGNVNDKIRRGSGGDHVVTRPGGEGFNYQDRSHVRTYPLGVGRLTWGYSGDPGQVNTGADPNATPGFLVADQIGGVGQTVWDRETQRGFELVGQQIEDYEQYAVHIRNPHTQRGLFSGVAISVDPVAGDIRTGDHFASNGVTPTFASQTVIGHTLSTGCTDAHCTILAPVGSSGFCLNFAKTYANVPDLVVSSANGAVSPDYTVQTDSICVRIRMALTAPVKFTYVGMGV